MTDKVDYFFMLFTTLIGLELYSLDSHGTAFATWVLTICVTITRKGK